MAKIPCSQSREPRFDPWSGNWIPHAITKTRCSQINIKKNSNPFSCSTLEIVYNHGSQSRLTVRHLRAITYSMRNSAEDTLPRKCVRILQGGEGGRRGENHVPFKNCSLWT